AERAVAADGPRLQPRRALPRLSPRLVVRERGRQRVRHRPLRAPGTQAKIDAKDEAVLGELAQRARHLLRKTREELRERPARRLLAVALVDVHEVDVGAVVELFATELPHAEDDEPPRCVAPLGGESRAR